MKPTMTAYLEHKYKKLNKILSNHNIQDNECTLACTLYAHTQHLNFSDNQNT